MATTYLERAAGSGRNAYLNEQKGRISYDRPGRQIRVNPYLESQRWALGYMDQMPAQEDFIQQLENQCYDKAERYERNIEEFTLGNNPIVMIEPMSMTETEEGLPKEYCEILDYVDGATSNLPPMLRFLTNGTVLCIPRSREQLNDIVTKLNEKCYIGIGTAKGFTQPLTRCLLEDSTGILVSSGINGDKRKFSDIGAFSQDAVTASRRALEFDKRRREEGLPFDAAIYSMEDPGLADVGEEFIVKSDTKPNNPQYPPDNRANELKFFRIGMDNPEINHLFTRHNDTTYDRVRGLIHYDPRLSKKRSLENYTVIAMDMIDSSEATSRLDRKSFKKLYKTMLAYYRTMLYSYESVWDKFYRPRLELQQQHLQQFGETNPVVIMYGESAEFYLPHIQPQFAAGLLDMNSLSYRFEGIAQKFDLALYNRFHKMLQSGIVTVRKKGRNAWVYGGYGQLTTGESSIPKLHKATSRFRQMHAPQIWYRDSNRRLMVNLDALSQTPPRLQFYDDALERLLKI